LKIRPATAADVAAISKTYAQSWRTTYQGLAPDVFVNGMTEPAANAIFHDSLQSTGYDYFLHVAETPEGQIVGYADGGRERSHPEEGIGELYGLYLLKDFQRQGIGRKLWGASAQSLVQAGIDRMIVWVLEANTNHPFYVSLGGVLQTGVKLLNVGGHEIRLVAYSWGNLKKSFIAE
jgi:GNAT superfamily N-acetyltransferase